MANVCCFRWIISNPFATVEKIEATFFSFYSTLRRWRATFQPVDRQANEWTFSFSIADDTFDGDVYAERVLVSTSFNGGRPEVKVIPNHNFCDANHRTFYIQETVVGHLGKQENRLEIRAEITFPARTSPNQGRNGLFFDERDLESLSEDMEELRCSKDMGDLPITWEDDESWVDRAHSYLVDVRWKKFFPKHGHPNTIPEAVTTIISGPVLSNILDYLYSGKFSVKMTEGCIVSHMIEILQVIHRYELYHLYKVLLPDTENTQSISKHLNVNKCCFPLEGVDGKPLENPSYTWRVNPDTDYEFMFQLKFSMNGEVPCFSYILQSRSRQKVFARVNVALVKKAAARGIWKRSFQKGNSEHEEIYTVLPADTKTCKTFSFEEDAGLFTDSGEGTSRGLQAKEPHFIRCVLVLSDGTCVFQEENKDNGKNDLESLHILSDHMHEMYLKQKKANLEIFCSPPMDLNSPQIPEAKADVFSVHRAIFYSRIPEWSAVMENLSYQTSLRTHQGVKADIGAEAFHYVVDYVYTAKTFPIPLRLLESIRSFANKCKFLSLEDLVLRMYRLY